MSPQVCKLDACIRPFFNLATHNTLILNGAPFKPTQLSDECQQPDIKLVTARYKISYHHATC